MNKNKIACTLVALIPLALCGCVAKPRNLEPAGFASRAEAQPYVDNYLYYARQLTTAEWDSFYQRFPEYWKDIQLAKNLGGTMEFHPWYSAYAFRWTTLNRKRDWPESTLKRLDQKDVQPGDDVFQIVYALGPPKRTIWNNDYEALAFSDEMTMVLSNHRLTRTSSCKGCTKKLPATDRTPPRWVKNEKDVARELSVKSTQ